MKAGGRLLKRRKKGSQETTRTDAGQAHHGSLGEGWSHRIGEKCGRESLEEIQRGSRCGGGEPREEIVQGGAGRPVQLSGNGESKGQCATDRAAESL